jgi:hypothetical protein
MTLVALHTQLSFLSFNRLMADKPFVQVSRPAVPGQRFVAAVIIPQRLERFIQRC